VNLRCACGKAYTLAEWLALPSPPSGDRSIFDEEDPEAPVLLYRNCSCGSTMALEGERVVTS